MQKLFVEVPIRGILSLGTTEYLQLTLNNTTNDKRIRERQLLLSESMHRCYLIHYVAVVVLAFKHPTYIDFWLG